MNRVLLDVLGLILLTAGTFAVATHYDVLTVVDRDARLSSGAVMPIWVLYAAWRAASSWHCSAFVGG